MANLFSKTTTKTVTFESYEAQLEDYENPGDALVVWFNYCYYLCFCPFRLKLCPESHKYVVHRHSLQKFFCFLMTVCSILSLSVFIQWNLYDIEQTDIRYFTVTKCLAETLHQLSFVIFVWSNPCKIQELINILYDISRRPKSNGGQSKSCIRFRISWMALGFLILLTVLKVAFEFATLLRNYPNRLKLVRNGTETLDITDWFFPSNETESKVELISVPMDPVELMLAVGTVLTENLFLFDVFDYRFDISHIVPYTTPIFIVMMYQLVAGGAIFLNLTVYSAWSMLSVVRTLPSELASATIAEGIKLFKEMKRLIILHNAAMELATFACVFLQIPTLMFMIPKLLQPDSVCQFFDSILDAVNIWGFLGMAALIVSLSTTAFEYWLIDTKIYEKMDKADRSILLHDLSQQQIAISATPNAKLTAGFLGAVINLVLTFSVVIVQFNRSTTAHAT